jgi:succinate dehydrogenase/fumarate reductase flavoprotein subunit
VVIVNHHLLCADASVRQRTDAEIVPSCPTLVVDEAHQLEDVATQYFGYSVSNYRLEELARDIERSLVAIAGDDRKVRDNVTRAVDHLRDFARAFYSEVAFSHRTDGRAKGEERIRLSPSTIEPTIDSANQLIGALELIEETLIRLKPDPTNENVDDEDVAALARRARELRVDHLIRELPPRHALERLQEMKERELPMMGATHTQGWLDAIDAVNMVDACILMTHSALNRKESRGPFIRTDYPEMDNEHWLAQNILIPGADGEPRFRVEPYALPYWRPDFVRRDNLAVPW